MEKDKNASKPEEKTPTATTGTIQAKSASDDQLMAALAHAGILITVIVALIIWLTQKDKSKYVEFQAKQALVYQLAVSVVLAVLWVMIMIIGFLTMGIGFILAIPLMLLGLAAVAYGLYAAWETYQGKDFRYAIIGEMLAKSK